MTIGGFSVLLGAGRLGVFRIALMARFARLWPPDGGQNP
jgi:hypothetical protein